MASAAEIHARVWRELCELERGDRDPGRAARLAREAAARLEMQVGRAAVEGCFSQVADLYDQRLL